MTEMQDRGLRPLRHGAKVAGGLAIAAIHGMRLRTALAAALLLGSLAAPRVAHAEGESYYLGGRLVSGGYGAPEIKATTLAGDGVVLAGGEAGWILAHSLVLGAGGYTTLTNVVAPASLQAPTGDARLGLGYGGIRAAAIFADESRLHGVFGVLVGGGSAWSENGHASIHRLDGFLVIEPELNLELNVTHFLRVALGGGYRFAANGDVAGFSPSRLGGPVALMAVRLGEF